jgi:hypothetical protein
MDIVYIDNSLAAQTQGEKLNEIIDRKKLKNAGDVIASAWGKDDAYVVAMVSATALVYNPSWSRRRRPPGSTSPTRLTPANTPSATSAAPRACTTCWR